MGAKIAATLDEYGLHTVGDVADRARARYGHRVLYPAALAISFHPPSTRQWDPRWSPGGRAWRRAA
ncbi:hypothetical protein [Streptomyces yerevanensis]|uniref:hypothetical protein n=1 Tax=Streptomyces yerevanensis TaxID=66378 RepID=UPI000523F71B|nr:hypothetical protein [Streptomyces yerevanensis]